MNKGKLIVLCGISNSGKSTFAATTVQHNPERYTRVNRDKIREMNYGYSEVNVRNYYYRGDLSSLEKEITKIEDSLIYEGLEAGKTVIVDATHLEKRYLERFKYWNVEVEVIFFDIELEEALKRNNNRVRKVDEDIIKNQYDKYKNLRKDLSIDFTPVTDINTEEHFRTLPDCIVFDIDGCLADNQGLRSPFDWSKVEEDIPIKSVVDTFNIYSGIKPLFICSGRDEVCREGTTRWLTDYLDLVGDVKLLMRDQGDFRPDWVVKQEMAREINKTHYISAWYDDRMQVTRHLRSLGIKVFNVEHNNF